MKLRVFQTYNTEMSQTPHESQQDNNSCSMVGLLGILIQVGLGLLSFSVLIIKRYYQSPKRPWKIWTFDILKQIISQLIAHFINLTISLALSYDKKNSDQCLWYFVTNVFDNTMGVVICILMLKLIENNFRKKRKFQLISGNYYRKISPTSFSQQRQKQTYEIQLKDRQEKTIKVIQQSKQKVIKQNSQKAIQQSLTNPKSIKQVLLQQKIVPQNQTTLDPLQSPQQQQYLINYRAWIIQLGIWNGIVVMGKGVLFGLQFGLQKQLQWFSIFILGWIEKYPVFQLLLVMVLVPVVMNGFAYWVQDNFLMKQDIQTQERNLLDQNHQDSKQKSQELQSNKQPFQNISLNVEKPQSVKQRKLSDFSINANHFELYDEYDSKDDENPTAKFQNFDKFDKYNL